MLDGKYAVPLEKLTLCFITLDKDNLGGANETRFERGDYI